jgi:hypothetical protein
MCEWSGRWAWMRLDDLSASEWCRQSRDVTSCLTLHDACVGRRI